MAASAIPVVDFQKYGLNVADPTSVASEVLETTAREIYDAFSTIGFVYLINHGVRQRKVDDMFTASKAFFDQPVEEKRKCARVQGKNYHGYVALESETLNPERQSADLKEAFNFTPKDDGAWPADVPQFKSTFFSFFDECKKLTERFLDVLSIGLKLQDRNFLRECHSLIGNKGNITTLRSLYYPRLAGTVTPGQGRCGEHSDYGTVTLLFQDDIGGLEDRNFLRECHSLIGNKGNITTLRSLYYPRLAGTVKPGQGRCGEHSDYGTVTLLFQDDIGGLEVMNTDDVYVPAQPVPGAIVVNIGDLMQRWTGDKLRAAKHRVLIPESELKKHQTRQSLAFFINPDDDTIIKCMDGSDKYEPISCLDYLNYKFSQIY